MTTPDLMKPEPIRPGIYDERGIWIAPLQHPAEDRPAGPWDMNVYYEKPSAARVS